MANYIKTLQEQNEKLQQELEQAKAAMVQGATAPAPYSNLTEEEDGRQEPVTIVYGLNAQDWRKETLPLLEGFTKLVDFYSQFDKPTDRNVPREYINAMKVGEACNRTTCYIKKTFKDKRSGVIVQNLKKEVPLWLAVDDKVQKGHDVQLISRKEFDDFYNEEAKKEIRRDRAYLEKKRQQLIDQTLQEG